MSAETIPKLPLSPPGGEFAPPPPRPRRRLVTPLTCVLGAVLIGALGFLGGVEVQKGQKSATATTGFPSFATRGGSGGPPAGFGNFGGRGSGTQGTVSYVKHGVLYVKGSDGNTIRVKVSSATKVTRTASTEAAKVHPGDTVSVQGKTSGGTVTATSVTATGS